MHAYLFEEGGLLTPGLRIAACFGRGLRPAARTPFGSALRGGERPPGDPFRLSGSGAFGGGVARRSGRDARRPDGQLLDRIFGSGLASGGLDHTAVDTYARHGACRSAPAGGRACFGRVVHAARCRTDGLSACPGSGVDAGRGERGDLTALQPLPLTEDTPGVAYLYEQECRPAGAARRPDRRKTLHAGGGAAPPDRAQPDLYGDAAQGRYRYGSFAECRAWGDGEDTGLYPDTDSPLRVDEVPLDDSCGRAGGGRRPDAAVALYLYGDAGDDRERQPVGGGSADGVPADGRGGLDGQRPGL